MHPHSFRHRFAINFLQENKDIALLADLMGHSGVNTTKQGAVSATAATAGDNE